MTARKVDLSRMATRTAAPSAAPAATTPAVTPAPLVTPAHPVAPVTAGLPAPVTLPTTTLAMPAATAPEAPAQNEDPQEKVTHYLRRSVRDRSHAAFRSVGYQEGFQSHSEMVAYAVETFVSELEAKHNQGTPFPSGGEARLRAGRPLGS